MKLRKLWSGTALAAAGTLLALLPLGTANATAPCGDFGECKVLVEINSSDGDVGFHFLMDGDSLIRAALFNPHHRKIFRYKTRRELREQFLTETFAESAEPLCWFDPEEDPDDVVTLAEFLDRWETGTYHFFGIGEDWALSFGQTTLSFALPAAPDDVEFDVESGEISWEAGDDLGMCAESDDEDPNVPNLDEVLHLLDEAPEDVPVKAWEVVLEPDVDDDDPRNGLKYTVRVPPGENSVTVPADYLASLGPNTPVKSEVGAIGLDDNATFTEEDGFCVNEDDPNPGDLIDGCGNAIEEDD